MKVEITIKEGYYTQIESADFIIMIFDENRLHESQEKQDEVDKKNEYFVLVAEDDKELQKFLKKCLNVGGGHPITVKLTHIDNHPLYGCFDKFEVHSEYLDEAHFTRVPTPNCRLRIQQAGAVRFF